MRNDKENNETKLGLGELTTKGRIIKYDEINKIYIGFAQCYKLGKWIRKRYNSIYKF
jgi:hypothetical protein